MARPQRDELVVVDSSDLTDADWAEINKLKKAHSEGEKSFQSALNRLAKEDPIRFMTLGYAFEPSLVREMIRDNLAEHGVSERDLRELIAKLSGTRSPKH